jgi:hypothetical protein
MDYRIIEKQESYFSVREPSERELSWIGLHPNSSKLVWVRINGVLREDLGSAGFNRLLEAVGIHIQELYAEELLSELMAFGLNGNVCFVRGRSNAVEISVNDATFPDGKTHDKGSREEAGRPI